MTRLAAFVEAALRLQPGSGGSPSGVLNTGILGSSTSVGQVAQNLQQNVLDFARAYADNTVIIAEVTDTAAHVEANLRLAASLALMSANKTEELIQELHSLLDERK